MKGQKRMKQKVEKSEKKDNSPWIPSWLYELDYHPLQRDANGIDEATDTMADFELEQLLNMLQIPLVVEKFMGFTLLASLDCFLYHFTVLPINIIVGMFSRHASKSRLTSTYKERVLLFLMISVSIVLSQLDTSRVYHRIKRQSAMKLYMLFSVLEIADKMLASMGQGLLSVLLSKSSYRTVRYKQLLLVSLTLIYLTCHSSVLIYQTISLNVAVNSYSNSLLTLLLSLQFAEIKGSVFKKFDKEGLFQITLADSAERFKLTILSIVIILRNIGTTPIQWVSIGSTLFRDKQLLISLVSVPILNIFGSEVIVDWIKHAYITKFNRIRPQIYDKFFYIMYRDHLRNQRDYQERLGLPVLGYAILSIVMLRSLLYQVLESTKWSTITVTTVLIVTWFSLLLTLKFITHKILLKWGVYIQEEWDTEHKITKVTAKDYVPGIVVDGIGKMDNTSRKIIHDNVPITAPDIAEQPIKRNKTQSNTLERVARYTMSSKRIW